MINKTCSCKHCGNDNLYYQMPTNLVFKVMALNVFWCHKCEFKNYYWAWNLTRAY
jgi:hypothetical protein